MNIAIPSIFARESRIPTIFGVFGRLAEYLQTPWLLASPKQRRPLRDVRRRHKVQIREFIQKNRIEKFEKCENCGSPKLPEHACIVCFEFIKQKVNQKLKF